MHGNPALSVAVFGTFLTSMSIIAAFAIEKESRWPTPREMLQRAHVPAWFTIGLGSVISALLADGFDSGAIGLLSLVLSVLAVGLGTRALWGLILLSSERGRWRLVVDLLSRSILKAEPPAREGPADLGEVDTEDHVPASFIREGEPRQPRGTGVSIERVKQVLGEYADRRELEAIVRLVDEVRAGTVVALAQEGSLDRKQYLCSVDSLLCVQRSIFGELANRVLAGQLGDATARIAVVRAGQATLDTGGRARQGAALVPGLDRDSIEQLVARHVIALARFAGYVTQEVDAQMGLRTALLPAHRAPVAERGGALALRAAAVELQQAVRWALDPEPPGMKLPEGHPWRSGLGSPEAVPVWLWSTVESASGPFGVALYASCQILTGEKFWKSYWDGFDVFTEISRRLAEPATPEARAAAKVVERCGGLELMTLELGATRLAATPPHRSGEPAFEHDPARRDKRHLACDLFLAAAGFKPPGRDPVADLALMLVDRPDGSLWTTVLEELRQLPDDVVPPPLQPLYRHPEACALAVCLRLAPLEEKPTPAAIAPLEQFVSTLPDPLLERTAKLGSALVFGRAPQAERPTLEARLIEVARFARHITPGPLPVEEAKGKPTLRPRVSAAEERAAPGLEGALEEIAAGTSLRVDLIQLNPHWLEEGAKLRAALDAELLAGALRGRLRVRRVVLYDLPEDATAMATRLHYRWKESLAAAARCFPSEDHQYEVRQILATRFGSVESLPEDGIFIRPAGDDAEASFESFWRDPEGGLIEL